MHGFHRGESCDSGVRGRQGGFGPRAFKHPFGIAGHACRGDVRSLQLLADEGLVTAEETAGKKVFSLTDAGRAAVAESADQAAPWEGAAQGDSGVGGLREAAGRLMPAIFQIGKAGSTDQVTAAIDVLNDARKKLYAILAED